MHQADICEFLPEEPADLVIAADILPYIDPRKFRATWKKIHDVCVKENGIFIGNLFRAAPTPNELRMVNMMKEMGAWVLPDRRMVRPLLADAGFAIEKCTYRQDLPGPNQICIQFKAKKLQK